MLRINVFAMPNPGIPDLGWPMSSCSGRRGGLFCRTSEAAGLQRAMKNKTESHRQLGFSYVSGSDVRELLPALLGLWTQLSATSNYRAMATKDCGTVASNDMQGHIPRVTEEAWRRVVPLQQLCKNDFLWDGAEGERCLILLS